jgi:hypothetical protein
MPAANKPKPYKKYNRGVYSEHWKDQSYTTKYWILVADDLTSPEAEAEFKRITGGSPYECDKSYEAFTHQFHSENGSLNIMMGFSGKATYNAIAHEACHALNRTFRYHGMDLDTSNDEHQCYYLGYLVDKAIEAVIEFNNKKNYETKRRVKKSN